MNQLCFFPHVYTLIDLSIYGILLVSPEDAAYSFLCIPVLSVESLIFLSMATSGKKFIFLCLTILFFSQFRCTLHWQSLYSYFKHSQLLSLG